MRNKQIVLAIFSMLLLLCSCAAQPNIAPQTQERETPQEKGPEMPESASTAANELFQMLLDAACPAGSAVRFGAWLDAHPDYADTVQDASCEYAAMENGTERVRFLKTNCDRFSRYAADASQTVVYQLWLVDGEVREGVSGALEPAPAEWEPAEWEKLAGFFVAEPLWTIDLASLDGFYALAPADANGTASGCAAPDSGLSVYSDGSVTLCFTEEAPGGPEILRHIWVCGSATVWTPWSKHWKPKTPSRASIGSSTTTTALRMAPASPSASRKRTDVSRSCSCMLTDNRCAEFHAQI